MLLAVNPAAMQHRTGALTFESCEKMLQHLDTQFPLSKLSILKYFKHFGSMLQWKHVDCRWDSAMNHWLYLIMLQGISSLSLNLTMPEYDTLSWVLRCAVTICS